MSKEIELQVLKFELWQAIELEVNTIEKRIKRLHQRKIDELSYKIKKLQNS